MIDLLTLFVDGVKIWLELFQLFIQLIYYYLEAAYRIKYPIETKSFKGFKRRVVLVTGAGHGIGKAIAILFSLMEARVVLWDINKERNEEVAQEIRDRGGWAKAYTCDVGDRASVQQMAEFVRAEVGRVDVLINNAGILNGGKIMSLKAEDIERCMNVNILAMFWTVRAFLPDMRNSRWGGHIINICSMAGKGGTAYLTDYCASKFAVSGFSESLMDELRRDPCCRENIRVTTVYPMFVSTGLTKHRRQSKKWKGDACADPEAQGGYSLWSRLTDPGPRNFFRFFSRWHTPEEVATATLRAAILNKREMYIPTSGRVLYAIKGLLPSKFITRVNSFLEVGIDPQYATKREGEQEDTAPGMPDEVYYD